MYSSHFGNKWQTYGSYVNIAVMKSIHFHTCYEAPLACVGFKVSFHHQPSRALVPQPGQ